MARFRPGSGERHRRSREQLRAPRGQQLERQRRRLGRLPGHLPDPAARDRLAGAGLQPRLARDPGGPDRPRQRERRRVRPGPGRRPATPGRGPGRRAVLGGGGARGSAAPGGGGAAACAWPGDWGKALAAELRRAVADTAGAVDYSYRRPSRRASVAGDVVLPALRRPVPEVAVVCDTSGSMTEELLAAALGEV